MSEHETKIKNQADDVAEIVATLSRSADDVAQRAAEMLERQQRRIREFQLTCKDYEQRIEQLERQAGEISRKEIIIKALKARVANWDEMAEHIEELETANKDKAQLLASFRSQIKELEAELENEQAKSVSPVLPDEVAEGKDDLIRIAQRCCDYGWLSEAGVVACSAAMLERQEHNYQSALCLIDDKNKEIEQLEERQMRIYIRLEQLQKLANITPQTVEDYMAEMGYGWKQAYWELRGSREEDV